MSSYYQFQSQQAVERIQARRQEAENHRRSRQEDGRSLYSFLVNLTLPVLTGALFAILLLNG